MDMDPFMQRMMELMSCQGDSLRASTMTSSQTVERFTDRDYLIREHDRLRASLARQRTHCLINTNQTVTVDRPTASAAVSLVPQNMLTLSQMLERIGLVAEGKFILCRTIVPPAKMTAVATVVDDPTGSLAMRLSLYNFVRTPKPLSDSELNDLLPPGTILAVKNPWFKVTADKGVTLRNDNPGNVVILSDEEVKLLHPSGKWKAEIQSQYVKHMKKQNEDMSSPQYWHRKGNELFVWKDYLGAVAAYTKAIQFSSPGQLRIDVFANRAAAYLNIEKFKEGMDDSSAALEADPTHLKAIYRNMKCLWGMKDFEAALSFLEMNFRSGKLKSADMRKIEDWITTTKTLIVQSTTGKGYPMKDVVTSLFKKSIPADSMLWAEYEGPVYIKKSEGKGRGLFASKKISPGQLIMASKAFGFVTQPPEQKFELSLSFNLDAKRVRDGLSSSLVTQLAQKIQSNPELGKKFYELSAGRKLGYLSADDDKTRVDLARIEGIVTSNAFGTQRDFSDGVSEKVVDYSGIWVLPSFMNHSCLDCNADWIVYGDFMFVRSIRAIDANEEITISYTTVTDPYSKRKKVFQSFEFQCACSLCRLEEAEPDRIQKQRETLLNEVEALRKITIPGLNGPKEVHHPSSIKKFRKLLNQVLALNPLRQPCQNIYLSRHLQQVAASCFGNGMFSQSAEFLESAHKMLQGSSMRFDLLSVSVNLVGSLIQANQLKKAKSWVKVMRTDAMTAFGSVDILSVYINTLRTVEIVGVMTVADMLRENIDFQN